MRSNIIDFLDGYENDEKYGIKSSGGKRFFSRSYSGTITKGRSMLKRTVKLGNRLTGILSFTASNAFGAGLLAYGLITFIAYFVIDYFKLPVENGGYSAIVGAVAAILAIPFLLSDKPIATVLQKNRVIDFVVFEFFCIKRPHLLEGSRPLPLLALVAVGAILGGLGFFVPSWIVGVVIISMFVIFVAFISPECTFMISLLALPYLGLIPYSDIVFSALICLTVLSFIRKVVCGKRVVYFEQYDLLIALMVMTVLVSGIFMKGTESFVSSLMMTAMALGYTLAGNLITNRRLAECALNAVVISSIPAAVYSVYRMISMLSVGADMSFGISSTFNSPAECAIFLVVSIVLAVALCKQATGYIRALYIAVALLDLTALVLTGEVFALLALLLGAAGYFVFKLRWLSIPLIVLLAAVPYAFLALPDSVTEFLASVIPGFDSTASLKELWRVSLEVFSENIFLGVGIGEESFAAEMERYGLFGYTDSKNTFIELGLEAGIFALIILALIMIVRIRHMANYQTYLKQTELGEMAPYIAAAVFSLVCYGATEYLWSQGAAFYLFWCVFGIGSAILRVAKREIDDRTLYYEDTRDVDYSAIDIELR